MDLLQNAITTISPLSAESMDAFHQSWKHWSVKKDHILLKENTVSDYIYFIEKGVARIYYYKNGKEITEWIALDGQFFLSITSFFQRTPSHLIIQTIEPSEVFGIHHDDFMKLADAFGIAGRRAHTAAELRTSLRESIAADEPALIEVPVEEMPNPWKVLELR